MPAECTQILPNGKKCAQFALRGRRFCSSHMDPERRRRSQRLHNVIASIPDFDLFTLLDVLIDTTADHGRREMPRAHAEMVYSAALNHLETLQLEMQREMARNKQVLTQQTHPQSPQ